MPTGVYERTKKIRRILRKVMIKRYQDPREIEKMKIAVKVAKNKPEARKRRREISRGLWQNPVYQKKIAETVKMAKNKPEAKKRQREITKKLWQDPVYREKVTKAVRIAKNKPKARKRQSEITRVLWQDSIYQKKVAEGLNLRPNNLEQLFNKRTPKCVCYVGDFSFWIVTKKRTHNPDFKIKGQSKIIEIFGNYWHKGENANELIKEYKEVGIDCKIFWENEVYNEPEKVIKEVKDFIKMLV